MGKENLKQTVNSFKLIGKVTRIDKDGAYDENTMDKGKREGELFRKLRFGTKTSHENEVTVSMFSYEPEKVFLWNSKKKEEDDNYKGDRVPFATWEANEEELREQGYAVLQSRVGLSYGEDGKLKSRGLPSFVAIEEIYNKLDNGDSVVIEGTISYSSSKPKDGEQPKEYKNYNIEKIFKLKDIDFDDEKFEEVSYFEQEMVFVDAMRDKKLKKVFVIGRTIDYHKNYHDTQLVVDYSDGDEGMEKLANAFASKFKFGDKLNVFGDIVNRKIVGKVDDNENSDEEEDLIAQLGGKSKPKHADNTNRGFISEHRINGVDKWDKKVYKETDFVKDDLLADDTKNQSNSLADELGGKSKKKSNPFEDDPFKNNGEPIDISDDDLPF